jgi:integrase
MAKKGLSTTSKRLHNWEVKKVLSETTGRIRMIFAVGVFTALRFSEWKDIRWMDLIDRDGTPHSRMRRRVHKQKTYRDITISKQLQRIALEEYNRLHHPPRDMYIFASYGGPGVGLPISNTSANKFIKDALEELGIDSQYRTTHALRKTFARRYYENYGEKVGHEKALVLLSDMLRHRTIAQTRHYLGLTSDEIDAGMDDLDYDQADILFRIQSGSYKVPPAVMQMAKKLPNTKEIIEGFLRAEVPGDPTILEAVTYICE